MELVVELSTGAVSLQHHDDMTRFSVRVVPQDGDAEGANGSLGALAAALSVHGAGTVDPSGDVMVMPFALRRLADAAAVQDGQALRSDWDGDMAAMIEFAASKGWITEDGAIRAHVEWKD